MDVRNLRTFMKVAELNNFTKAAAALGYSQSAVTVQMQQLEAELGLPLFDRIGKNITLTQYGTNFISYAGKVIEAMERAENFASDLSQMKGTLRFGIVDSILYSCFLDIIPEFNRRYPHISLKVYVGSAREIEAKIRTNELDLCYMLDYKVPRKEWVRVREEIEPIIFVASPSHPLTKKQDVHFIDIINQKLMLMPQGEGYRYLFDDELAKRNLYATPAVEISSTQAMLSLAENSDYITMIPVFAARKHVRNGTLGVINVTDCELQQWSQLAYLKGKALTPQLELFIETLHELLPPLQTEPSKL